MINQYTFNYYIIRLFEDVQEVSYLNMAPICPLGPHSKHLRRHILISCFFNCVEWSQKTYRKRLLEMLRCLRNSPSRDKRQRLTELRRERSSLLTLRSTWKLTMMSLRLTLTPGERQRLRATFLLRLNPRLYSSSEPEGKYNWSTHKAGLACINCKSENNEQ